MTKYTGTSTLESMSQAGFYNQWTLNKFKKYLKGEILEIGCGIGNFTKTLAQFGNVTAIDIDKGLIEEFQRNGDLKIDAGFGDIEKGEYFFDHKTFDTIVCINVLEHIKDDKKALENIYNLLNPGGSLILLVPIHNFLYGEIDRSIGHFRRYSPKQLIKKLKELKLIIVSQRKLNFIGALGWFISGKVLGNKQITEDKIRIFNFISPILYTESILEPPIGTSVLVIAKKDQ